ncbi:MAG TPA: hypothetical protein V6D50_20295, partial [Chroococcales cyanobacterium]
MSKKTVNLGLELVNEEIDNALELYPEEPYRTIFASPELRQKLINYVMSGLQGFLPSTEDKSNRPAKETIPYRSLELRLHVENYVHWGIEYILETNPDSIAHA